MIYIYSILMTVLIALLALTAYLTPTQIPKGFPFAAKMLEPAQLSQKRPESAVLFVDRTLEKGLNFVHQQGGEQLAGIDETLGAGVCAADFNNDGWTDVFLVNGTGHTRYYGKQYWWQASETNALFLNTQGRGFKDATAASGLDKPLWGMGCLGADFDNDGDTDLLLTGKDARLLYQNNGTGTFTDVTAASGLASQTWATSAAAADMNGDGLLDIYIGNFIDFSKGKKTFEANSQFTGEKRNTFDASLYDVQNNQLYLNKGGLKFTEIAASAGVQDAEGRTLDVSWQYLNDDNKPDLLVTNERGTGSNTVYLNTDGEHFEPGGQALGLRSALGNRGISSGDLDNDGEIDLLIASAMGENTAALLKQPRLPGSPDVPVYKERARELGIGRNAFLNRSAWTGLVQDFNNDGYNDVFIVSGMLEPDADTNRVSLGQAKQLLVNSATGQFTDATATAGIALQDQQSARGAVAADFDNDGDVDVYVVHNNDLGQYLDNETPKAHWLGLKLVGKPSNRDAIGALVKVTTAQGVQVRRVSSGEGFLSDNDKRLLVGLGGQDHIAELHITWPSGQQQQLTNIAADRYWLLEEGNNTLQALPGATPVAQQLRLKLGINDPKLRAQYVQLLGAAGLPGLNAGELAMASHDPDTDVRRAVIEVAATTRSPAGLSLLVQGLEDPQPDNVLAALAGLQGYEEETSVRWLLRLFAHPDARVRAATSHCFAMFFQEEEAVVHRKYLALPYLIGLLADPVASVRASAARALANAERFRGVHALVAQLDDPDAKVRAAIIQSLGLIRQRLALKPIQAVLSDASQPAEVLSESFIALKRLGDEAVNETLSAFILGQGAFAAIPAQQRWAVLANLMATGDVFAAAQLQLLARHALATVANSDDTIARLAVIRQLADPAYLAWTLQQTKASSTAIRAAAYPAAYALQAANQRLALLRRALADTEPTLQLWAADILLAENSVLTADDYQHLVATPALRNSAAQYWSKHPGLPHPEWLLAALTAPLPNAPGSPTSKALESLCLSPALDVQAFCPLLLLSQNTPEHQSMTLKVLSEPRFALATRLAVLNAYGLAYDPDALNVVYALAHAKKDLLRHAAIAKLLTFNADSLLEFANKLANNATEMPEDRLQAILFLIRTGHPEAQDILYR